MPSKNMNIVYCTEIDGNGCILSTSMLIHGNANELAEGADELFKNRRES